MNKTCGECKYYEHPAGQCSVVIEYNNCHTTDEACEYFEHKVFTNGDVIREMSNEELLCSFEESWGKFFGREDFLAWLNAPAESEGEDE